MLALLKLIPFRDWLWAALAAALAALLLAGAVHERHVQAAKDAAANAREVALIDKHNTDLQNLAATKDAAVEKAYEDGKNAAPMQPVPHVLCYRPRTDKLPAAPGSVGSTSQGPQSGVSASDSGAGSTLDIGPPITVRGKDADAQIRALQQDVQNLLDEMTSAKH